MRLPSEEAVPDAISLATLTVQCTLSMHKRELIDPFEARAVGHLVLEEPVAK